jgi:hypothetical protein
MKWKIKQGDTLLTELGQPLEVLKLVRGDFTDYDYYLCKIHPLTGVYIGESLCEGMILIDPHNDTVLLDTPQNRDLTKALVTAKLTVDRIKQTVTRAWAESV